MAAPPLTPGPEGEDEGPPRWVKAFGIVAIVLVVLFVVVHLTVGGLGNHGMPAGGTGIGGSHP